MKRLLHVFILATGLLAACNQGGQPNLEALALTFNNIQWLTNIKAAPDFTRIVNKNCMTNALNLPGQGFRASGTDGGLTYDLRAASTLGITTANSVGSNWRTVSGLLGTPNRDVTILVVDDFRSNGVPTNGVYAPTPDLFTQTALTGATLGQLQDNKKLSHGALVLQHTLDTIKGTGLYPFSSSPSAGVTVFRTTSVIGRTTRSLTVKAIDTGLTSTAIIKNSIESSFIATKISTTLDSTPGGPHVVNMSFALLPCEPYADFLEWDKVTLGEQKFEEYITALAVKNGVVKEELINVIVEATNDTTDPLYQLIQSGNWGWFRNIHVAASGNYGFNKTAMYPAKWNSVIDATGSAANNTGVRNSNFNQGEIMDIAGSLQLTASNFTSLAGAKNVYYKGTSFSTPSLSVFSALDLAGKRRCTQITAVPNNGNVITPSLAMNLQNLVDSPLTTAVTKLCLP